MHTFVLVIVPATTVDIKSEVDKLLSGSEYASDKQFKQYESGV